ncbi:Trafficking protein particle complex subunit 8 [Globisporangium polare]
MDAERVCDLKRNGGEDLPVALAQEEQGALRVLRKFVRNQVATWRLRVEIKNVRVLVRVFERASSSHHLANRTRDLPLLRRTMYTAVERQRRVIELRHRVSTASTDSHNQSLEYALGLEEAQEDPENSSSSECEECVSVESVVHKLFLQIEATKHEGKAKDARILELEALVASLTCKNQELRRQLQKDTSSQATRLHSCGAGSSEEIDDLGSNQLVME